MLKKINKWKIIIGGILIILVVQLAIPSPKNPIVDSSVDFVATTEVKHSTAMSLKQACYDCHSYQTRYPIYSRLYPINKWIKGHVEHGRKKLNFSEWGTFSETDRILKLDFIAHEINQNTMPLSSYKILHKSALIKDELKELILEDIAQVSGAKKAERIKACIQSNSVHVCSNEFCYKLVYKGEEVTLEPIGLFDSHRDIVRKSTDNQKFIVVDNSNKRKGKDIHVRDPGDGKYYPILSLEGDEFFPTLTMGNEFLFFVHKMDENYSLYIFDLALYKGKELCSIPVVPINLNITNEKQDELH
jgi:hypothetical protein